MQPRKSTHIRRKEIVQAALAVVAEKGVQGITIAEIAGRAGMSDANIYRHFNGKQEILGALSDFIGEAVVGKAATIAAGKRKALDKLGRVFRSHIALITANPGLPRFIFSEELQLGDRRLAASVASQMASYVEILSAVIADGIRVGELRRDISPRETAITLLGMIQFTVLRWFITHGAFSLEAEATRLWGNFKRLLQEGSLPGRV